MASVSTIILAVLVAVLAAAAGYLYLFGIPADLKRDMEEKALETMGENQASELVKNAVGKIPESEQRDYSKVKKNLDKALGENNPLSKLTGDNAEDAIKDFAGR